MRMLYTTCICYCGNNYLCTVSDIHKSELLLRYGIQARDIRFSTFSSLYVRSSSIIVRLQVGDVIITSLEELECVTQTYDCQYVTVI